MIRRSLPTDRERAFTLVELVVAGAIAMAAITVAVIAFRTLTAAPRASSNDEDVTIGSAAMDAFYAETGDSIVAPSAPSAPQRAQAEVLRTRFYEDLRHASAVFCLGRTNVNTIHPSTIAVSGTFQGRAVGTPEDFRQVLAAADADAATIFEAYRGACTSTNGSIFILEPSASLSELAVRAIYDIDLIATTSPLGVYASVKRFVGGSLTNYYHVFYPAGTALGNVAFNPLFVAFERNSRAAEGDDTIDRLKVAAGRPFYFIWWPDPAERSLLAASSGSYASSEPRASYPAMGGRTSFFFVVPMMPAL
jgi:hypothetical protein